MLFWVLGSPGMKKYQALVLPVQTGGSLLPTPCSLTREFGSLGNAGLRGTGGIWSSSATPKAWELELELSVLWEGWSHTGSFTLGGKLTPALWMSIQDFWVLALPWGSVNLGQLLIFFFCFLTLFHVCHLLEFFLIQRIQHFYKISLFCGIESPRYEFYCCVTWGKKN